MILSYFIFQSFLDIVSELEKQGEVSSESIDLIEQCLRDIKRIDLVKKINQYKTTGKCHSHKLTSNK